MIGSTITSQFKSQSTEGPQTSPSCCVEDCGHYDGDDPVARQVWAEWNSLPEDELSPVKTIAASLGLSNAEVSDIVYSPGTWSDDQEPMRPWFPTEEITLFDTEDPSPRPMEGAVLVMLVFVGAEGNESMLVEALDSLDDGSGWVGALNSVPVFLPMQVGDLVTFGHEHILEVHYSDQCRRVPKEDNRCRLWTADVNEEGYAIIDTDEGGWLLAAEWSLFNVEGQEKIDGFEIYWLCDNKLCVRPSHLEQLPSEEVPLRKAAMAERKEQAAKEVIVVDAELLQGLDDSLWIPELAERKSVPIGESVKLIFTDTHSTERMWVQVVAHWPGGGYEGVLKNTPIRLPLEAGRPISFEARNIVEIHCGVECHGAES